MVRISEDGRSQSTRPARWRRDRGAISAVAATAATTGAVTAEAVATAEEAVNFTALQFNQPRPPSEDGVVSLLRNHIDIHNAAEELSGLCVIMCRCGICLCLVGEYLYTLSSIRYGPAFLATDLLRERRLTLRY